MSLQNFTLGSATQRDVDIDEIRSDLADSECPAAESGRCLFASNFGYVVDAWDHFSSNPTDSLWTDNLWLKKRFVEKNECEADRIRQPGWVQQFCVTRERLIHGKDPAWAVQFPNSRCNLPLEGANLKDFCRALHRLVQGPTHFAFCVCTRRD